MPETISAASVNSYGQDPAIEELSPPIRSQDEVLLRMHCAALNFADLLQARGEYQERVQPPFVPGLEGAGEVLEAPDGSGLIPGDRVAVCYSGTLAQMIAVPQDACIKIPRRMSFEQAAGFQIAYGSSHLALTGLARLQPDETLVVLGAAGGVGLTAVEIGHALGARVIGVVRGADKLQTVTDAGAEMVIDSAECTDLRAELRKAGGVHVVYDPVGGTAGKQAFGALRRGGRFLVIGFASGTPPELPLNHALVKNIAIHGFYWGGYRELNPTALRQSLEELFALFDKGKLTPVAGEILPLSRLADGYEMLRSRKAVGKILISM
ncbi:NADPH:quinone oxidoreductase family protein [Paracoccus onubensis]|uniref:NADPH:quinone oxidoreductase family protein n=1 Tax=Paracoccus onubensis TaxID=1675788 RepID=A0A418SZY7_9RHOB|nr:NADPH:quinone oxidoreductase family protein [Paracoccus onubensis]RJE86470.1 NADPH:quinone oxidoreductase family protein [Paracoccus onubensis]